MNLANRTPLLIRKQTDPTKIYFEQYGDRGPWLFLLHGYMANRLMFDPVVQHFAANFQTVVLDNRGFGHSANLPGPYSIDQMANDVLAVMDQLNAEAVHIMGYSKGGCIAQVLGLHHPQRVRSLALSVTFAHKIMTPLERMQQQFLPSVIKRVGAKGMARMMYDGITGGVNLTKRDLSSFRRMLAECRDDVLLQTGYSLFKFDSRDSLAKLSIPTLVIGGTDDIVVPVHHSRFLAANIPGAKLKVFERAGHGMVYTHSAKLAQHANAFFLKHEPPADLSGVK